MVAPTPARLLADRHCLIVLERVLRAAEPLEGCALLLGQQQGSTLTLQRIWPCCNSWQPAAERTQRFRLDPREQLLAQRWARQHGLQVLGSAHSHPSSPAVPSATDRCLCLGPTLMLIRSGLPQPEPLRAWWLQEAPEGELAAVEELPLHLERAAGAGHLGE
jgi:[CysO sulfur-carrier protein]-S-L-cysteine hydrolase